MPKRYDTINVYVDIMNMFFGLKQYAPNKKVHWGMFFADILAECEHIEAFFYGPKLVDPIEPWLAEFYDNFKNISLPDEVRKRVQIHIYEDLPKPVFDRTKNRVVGRKDHCDMNMALAALEAAISRSAGKHYYFTGDRDFIPLFRKVKHRYLVPIHIIAVDETTASEMRREFPHDISYLVSAETPKPLP